MMKPRKLFHLTKTTVKPAFYSKAIPYDVTAFSRDLQEPAYIIRTCFPEVILSGEGGVCSEFNEAFRSIDETTISNGLSILDKAQGRFLPRSMRKDATIEIDQNLQIQPCPLGSQVTPAIRMDSVWIREIIIRMLPQMYMNDSAELMRNGLELKCLESLEMPACNLVDNPAIRNSLRLVLKALGYDSVVLKSTLDGVKGTCYSHKYDIPKVVITRVGSDRDKSPERSDLVRAEVTKMGEIEPSVTPVFRITDSTLSNLIGSEFARDLKGQFLVGSPARSSFSLFEEDLIGCK